MKRWKVLLSVALVGSALLAFKPAPTNSLNDFRVVTFNIRNSTMNDPGTRAWSERRPVASAMLLRLDADILGFQEVSPEQRADLDQDLSGYRGVGTGREAKGRGEQCPIYSRRGLMSEAEGMFWLSPTPLRVSVGWDAKMPRICTWVRYPGVTIFNTHLDYAGPASRREALKLIRRQAKGSAVIMGDFNDLEGSQTMEPVEDLVDAFRAVYPRVESNADGTRIKRNDSTYNAFKKDNPHGRRLDFIYVTPDLEPVEAEIASAESSILPSDHRALVVRLKRGAPMPP